MVLGDGLYTGRMDIHFSETLMGEDWAKSPVPLPTGVSLVLITQSALCLWKLVVWFCFLF